MSADPPVRAVRVLIAGGRDFSSAAFAKALDDERFDVATFAGPARDLVTAAAGVDVLVVGAAGAIDELATLVPRLLGAGTRLLVVSDGDFDDAASGLLFAGASGFLSLRDAGPDEVAEAVLAVSRGSTALNPDIVHEVLLRWRAQRAAPPPLSSREGEVLRAVCGGLTNRLIARQLGVAEKTVEAHKSRLFAKLGARNQAQAVRIAVDRGLV